MINANDTKALKFEDLGTLKKKPSEMVIIHQHIHQDKFGFLKIFCAEFRFAPSFSSVLIQKARLVNVGWGIRNLPGELG